MPGTISIQLTAVPDDPLAEPVIADNDTGKNAVVTTESANPLAVIAFKSIASNEPTATASPPDVPLATPVIADNEIESIVELAVELAVELPLMADKFNGLNDPDALPETLLDGDSLIANSEIAP